MCIIAKSLFSRLFNKWLLKLTGFHERNVFPVIPIGVVLQWRPPVWTLSALKHLRLASVGSDIHKVCVPAGEVEHEGRGFTEGLTTLRWSSACPECHWGRLRFAAIALRLLTLFVNCYIVTLLVPFISNGRSNFTGLTLSSCVVKHQTSGTFWKCSLQNTHNAFYIFPPATLYTCFQREPPWTSLRMVALSETHPTISLETIPGHL